MLRNADLYRHRARALRWKSIRALSPEESIEVGEALLTSEILRLARFPRRRHRCFADLLGVRRSPVPGAPQESPANAPHRE